MLILISVFILTLSVLVHEVALTRLFSFLHYYHYVFIIVSGAIVGLGLGAFLVHRRSRPQNIYNLLARNFRYFSLALPASVLLILMPFPNFIPGYSIISTIPFFFAGILLSSVYRFSGINCNTLYFFDLAGAASGCLLVVPAIRFFGSTGTILFIAAITAATGMAYTFYSPDRRGRKISAVIFLVIFVSFLANAVYKPERYIYRYNLIQKPMFLELKHGQGEILDTDWNIFARTDLVEDFRSPDLKRIYTDGENDTIMLRFDGDLKKLEKWKHFIGYIPYQLGRNREILTIGAGSGIDVVLALLAGSYRITAVEVNPSIVDVVRKYSTFNGGIYQDFRNINVVVDEGRSFVRRHARKYDLIYLALVLTPGPQAKSYMLLENYIYTVEAFEDYLDSLREDGMLAIVEDSVERTLRLFTTGISVLTGRGENAYEASRHLAMVSASRSPDFPDMYRKLFILKKSPFSRNESARLLELCRQAGAEPVFIPGLQEQFPFSSLAKGVPEFIANIPFNTTPCTDNKPFFYDLSRGIFGKLQFLLFPLVVLLILVMLIILALIQEKNFVDRKRILFFLLYFSGIGTGFMLIETVLIQKFILFVGYPSLTFSVILFSLLLAGGVGSISSKNLLKNNQAAKAACAAVGTGILITGYIYMLPPLFDQFIGYGTVVRSLITMLLIFPLGFFLGIPFPAGLELVKQILSEKIAWMWGLNGIASVLGSTAAVVGGLIFGFNTVLFAATFVYLAVALDCLFFLWKAR